MDTLETIKMAFRTVKSNLLRSILTLMIIAVGIMALVGILTAVDGIKAGITNMFAGLGANTFSVVQQGTGITGGGHGRRQRGEVITLEEALDFKERYVYPSKVSITTQIDFIATIKSQDTKTDPNVTVQGVDENHLTLGTLEVGQGRNFTETEIQSGADVTVIGEGIAKKLFKKAKKALDQNISINNKRYRVIGILASKGNTGIFNSDNICIIGIFNGRNRFPSSRRSYTLNVSIPTDYNIDIAVSEATGLMRSVRKVPLNNDDNFTINKSDKLSGIFIDQISMLAIAAYVIAFITLIGAAIALMNIMLVAVNERQREVGISKAIGAKNRNIFMQFLWEAIVICQLGGMLGIVMGIFIGNVVSWALNGPFIIPWMWISVGIFFCFVVGIIAGSYPAVKASRLDPIESLRIE